jgi:hypothetical protein
MVLIPKSTGADRIEDFRPIEFQKLDYQEQLVLTLAVTRSQA